MTEDTLFTESKLYTLPDIRAHTIEQLQDRLEIIRQRRLVTAIEFQSKMEHKLNKEGHKLTEQWTKAAARIAKKIEDINADFAVIDKELQKLTELHHKLSILE